MRLTVLGSGTSFGVPVVGCGCDVCSSNDPRDRRTRTSALIERDDDARLLIDTPPELRLQMLGAKVDGVDAVLYTHEHADHLHGIDDLRAISIRRGGLALYGAQDTLNQIQARFGYIFDPAVRPPPGTSKPELVLNALAPWEETVIAGFSVLPVEVDHGGTTVFGYRVENMAYVTDAKSVSNRAVELLRGIDVLVLNALFERPHPTHLSINEAVQLAERIGASRVFLTHLTHRFSHAALESRLPDGVSPAYDGLAVTF